MQGATSAKKAKRSCGDCTACCTFLRIDSGTTKTLTFHTAEDVSKPAGETCRFCTAQGCSIYDDRPIVCRAFKCDWLEGRSGYKPEDHPLTAGYIGVRGDKVAIKKLD